MVQFTTPEQIGSEYWLHINWHRQTHQNVDAFGMEIAAETLEV
jgi:hypothetical protein